MRFLRAKVARAPVLDNRQVLPQARFNQIVNLADRSATIKLASPIGNQINGFEESS
jgi:hypothetical protein